MDKPKIEGVIVYNGDMFGEGNIVDYKHTCGFGGNRTGKIVNISKDSGNVTFDYSSEYNAGIQILNITEIVSISHAPVKEV